MEKRRKRSPWPLALLFRLIVIVSAAALAISYLSVYVNPSVVSFTLFFGLYFIPLVILNLFILLAGIIRRTCAVWITFITLLPAILFAELFVRWGEVTPGNEGTPLKVCTYNVGLFSQGVDNNYEKSFTGIKEFLNTQKADIVCLQEFYIQDTTSIAAHFPQYPYFNYHLFRGRRGWHFGNLTLSKHPITHKGEITFKGSTNLATYTDIDFYGKKIRIYNSHLESHSISFTSLIKKMRESEKVTNEIYEVHDKVAGTFRKRATQVDVILNHSANSQYPAIICGDLNDTPMSYTYHRLVSERKDSFRQSGKGFSATYSLLWPLLRIDYILYPEPFWSKSHTTPRIEYSDHYPVVSELIIP